MIVRQNCKPRSAGEAIFRDPPAHGFGHAAKVGVSTALDVIVALEFQRDIVRPALGTLDKAIVECGHSSWRIYTKSASGRSMRGASRASPKFRRPTTRCPTSPGPQMRWSIRCRYAEKPQLWESEE